MNKLFSTRIASAILVISLWSLSSLANDLKTTLKKGMFNKQITVAPTFNWLGNYQCFKLTITNNTTSKLTVTVDPGLIFLPEDTVYQNMVTWGDEKLALEPSATSAITVYAFCGKSYGHGPRKDLKYTFWRQGDSNMIKTLKYTKTNNLNTDLTQDAVWTFTNNHSLNTVYTHSDPVGSETLIKYLATLRKLPVPTQFLELMRHNRPNEPVTRPGDVRKLYVPMKWANTNDYRHMYVTVYKQNGDVYKKIEGHEEIDKNGHTVWVEFNSVNDVKGIYYVELKDNYGKIRDRKTVEVGYNM